MTTDSRLAAAAVILGRVAPAGELVEAMAVLEALEALGVTTEELDRALSILEAMADEEAPTAR